MKNVFTKRTIIVVSITIAVILTTIIAALTNPPTQKPLAPGKTPNSPATASLTNSASNAGTWDQVFSDNKQILQAAADEAEKKVNLTYKGPADTPEANAKFVELQTTIKLLRSGEPIQGFIKNDPTVEQIQDMNNVTQTTVANFQAEVDTWTTQVNQVKTTLIPVGETDTQQIERIQKEIGQVLPFQIGDCITGEIIWGCYTPGNDFYTITPDVLAMDECHLRSTLAHEYQHYIQWKQGLTSQHPTEWLEADARDKEWLGGGC
jgi:hypothetical protein